MAERDESGRFIKGHQGYKKSGKKHFDGLRKALKSREPEVIEAAIKQALDGTSQAALLFLLKKMYGNDPFNDFRLQGDNVLEMSKSLLSAVGQVDAAVLNNAAKVIDTRISI